METHDNSPAAEPDPVQLLIGEACRLMEEASPELALALPAPGPDRTATLAAMRGRARAIGALLEAAVALDRLYALAVSADLPPFPARPG